MLSGILNASQTSVAAYVKTSRMQSEVEQMLYVLEALESVPQPENKTKTKLKVSKQLLKIPNTWLTSQLISTALSTE